MQIHQMLAALSYGDAIGNEALRIQQILRSRGFDSEIFAESVHPETAGMARKLWDYRNVSSPDNVLILHFSIGAGVSTFAYHLPDRILLVYHNITPARWFVPYHEHLAGLCYHGRRELAAFVDRTNLALGDSEFNRTELEAMGFHPTGVLPLLLEREQLDLPPSPAILEMFDDEKTNFLFVGRIIPNKRFEGLIKVFYIYQKYFDPNCRLVLVGESKGFERYFDALVRYLDELELKDVVLTGHVDTDDLAAYYRVADLFLCLSEHEGFCVPLIEAFRFGVPVMAFEAGAVSETLGGAGILIREKRFDEIAEMAHLLVHDEDLRQRVIAGQYAVLEKMDRRDDASLLMSFIDQVLRMPASAKASAFAKASTSAKASAFAKASTSAKASADRSADRSADKRQAEGNGG
jgi:glycosyltransferase involved in cell wall biosynthesis